MKIGDLVRVPIDWSSPLFGKEGTVGIIMETGVYVGRKDIKVLWSSGDICTEQSQNMELISESR